MQRRSALVLFVLGGLQLGSVLTAQTIFGRNLVVNGDAESGTAGWTVSGSPRNPSYSGLDLLGPFNRGTKYFQGGGNNAVSTLSQNIDISSVASNIDAGKVTFDASAYLGGGSEDYAGMTVAFNGASGNQLSTVTLGPVQKADRPDSGMMFRRVIGAVPAGARTAVVTVTLTRSSGSANDGYADNISLILNNSADPQTILNTNLIQNPGGESIPASFKDNENVDLPSWVRSATTSIELYTNGGGDLAPTDPGPADRGNAYFWGGSGEDKATAYQDIDVSAGAALIDTGSIKYAFSGWIGGYSSQDDNATVTLEFRNLSGTSLGSTTIGPVTQAERQGRTELLQRTASGTLPSGTRVIRVTMTFNRLQGGDNDGLIDNLSLTLTSAGASGAPAISSNGVVSAGAFGGFSQIAPGSWIEIYGSNLAGSTRGWAGSDFSGNTAPTSLDGVRVTIGDQPAYIDYISPTQINVEVPSNVSTGQQQIVVTNSAGSSAAYMITVNPVEPGLLAPPSFVDTLSGRQYLVATLPDGTYVLPPGVIQGVPAQRAKPGDTLTIYGVGFGPVTQNIPAGQIATTLNNLSMPFQIKFGNTPATVTYAGLAPNYVGLYQFNVLVPAVGPDDRTPVTFTLGGSNGPQTLYTAIGQ